MIFTMKVPLTFKIGDNMNNFFLISSFFHLLSNRMETAL